MEIDELLDKIEELEDQVTILALTVQNLTKVVGNINSMLEMDQKLRKLKN